MGRAWEQMGRAGTKTPLSTVRTLFFHVVGMNQSVLGAGFFVIAILPIHPQPKHPSPPKKQEKKKLTSGTAQ